MEFDWSEFTTRRKVMLPEQGVDYRQILIDGLLQWFRAENSSLITSIDSSVAKHEINTRKATSLGLDYDQIRFEVELIHIFNDRKKENGGVLISELSDPRDIEFFKTLYKVEPDIVYAVSHANLIIRGLNDLQWNSYDELRIGVRQLDRYIRGLRGGEDISYSESSPEVP